MGEAGPKLHDLGSGVNAVAEPSLDDAVRSARHLAEEIGARLGWHDRRGLKVDTSSAWDAACLEKLIRLGEAVLPFEDKVKAGIVRWRREARAAAATRPAEDAGTADEGRAA